MTRISPKRIPDSQALPWLRQQCRWSIGTRITEKADLQMTLSMPKSEIVVALIRNVDENGVGRWLLKRKAKSTGWSFIRCERLEGESARTAISREVAWELGLDSRIDFLVANMAQLHLPAESQVAAGSGRVRIEASFFTVDLFTKRAKRHCAALPDLLWATAGQICSGALGNGEVLDRQDYRLIQRSEVIQPWH